MTLNRKDLEKIAFHLRAVLSMVESEIEPEIVVPPDVEAEVQRKIAEGICLAWDHAIPKGSKVLRGLCETDYATTMARIRRGEDTERELMLKGQLASVAKPGRKAARDIAAEHAAKIQKVAELAERYNNRKKPEDKSP